VLYIFWITLLVFLTSVLGTLAGFGISSMMLPVLSLFLPFPTALFFVAIIHWITSIWRFVLARQYVNWCIVLYFGIVGIFTSFLGGLYVVSHPLLPKKILGAFLILYVVFLIIKPTFQMRQENPLVTVVGGGIYGFINGIIGVGGAIKNVFLLAFHLPKFVHISTLSAISIIVDAARVSAYLMGGASLPTHLFYGLVIFIPISFSGVSVAFYLVDKIPQNYFRVMVSFFLFILGIKLLVW